MKAAAKPSSAQNQSLADDAETTFPNTEMLVLNRWRSDMIEKSSILSGLFAATILLGGIATVNTAFAQNYVYRDRTTQDDRDRRCPTNSDRFDADCYAVYNRDRSTPYYPSGSLSSPETSRSDNNPNNSR
jgi:hypothetical protein